MGTLFERAAHNSHYNEVIIDSVNWSDHLPTSIEAFFYVVGSDDIVIRQIRRWHSTFVAAYGLSDDDCAILELDPSNWQAPFRGV